MFWDDVRVERCTATAADCEQKKGGKTALQLEQTAAGAWVKGQGWDCTANYLEGDNLSQVPVQVRGGGGGYNDMDCLLAFVGRKFCTDLLPCVEGGEVAPSRYECVERYFVRDRECPQSLWACGDPVGPPLGGPHVGDCEGMGHPVRIEYFQG